VTTYRVAIVGLGRKGSTIDDENRWLTNYDRNPCSHASAYVANERTQIIAVADPSPAKLAAFSARYGECATYNDYRAMLARERPELVSVCTHAPLHAKVTVAAAAAGAKGVLVEKAMAVSLAECDAMLAACEQVGAKLLVNHPRRFHATFRAAKLLLDSGELGPLQVIIASGYNKFAHNGSHAFDMLRYFAGEATAVQGELVEREDPEDFDGRAVVRMQSGVTGFVDFASSQPFAFQIWCPEGRITIDQFSEGFAVSRFVPENPDETGPWFRYRPKREVVERLVPSPEWPMQNAVDELVAAVDGNREPASHGLDGRAALELIVAAHESAAQGGAWIAVPVVASARVVRSR